MSKWENRSGVAHMRRVSGGLGSDGKDAATLGLVLRWLRRLLPWVMIAVFLAGLGGGLRLAVSLGQPFPGFALMWRKELKLLVVSNVTLPYWPGIAAGMQINDRIRCVDGYMPSPEATVYGLDVEGQEVSCPNGDKSYFDIFQDRYASTTPSVSMLVVRQQRLVEVPNIPIVAFDLKMLLETLLPSFILGLGYLGLGAVVLRANPANETNLIFATFTTIIASFAMNQAYSFIITPRFASTALAAVLMVVPWMPMLGVVFFHLIDRLLPSGPLTDLSRQLRGPYYLLSALAAGVGIFTFAMQEHPLTYLIGDKYLGFIAGSISFAVVWSIISLVWMFARASSRRVRWQTGLILCGLIVTGIYMVPYFLFFLSDAPATSSMSSLPYLGLVFVAILAYAILRYQVFAAQTTILTLLVVTIICIMVANLIYVLEGQRGSILPIMAAALLTGFVLETRQGPGSFFNRLLRREVLDYRAIVRFSEQVGQLQKIDPLLAGIRKPLYDSLDVERVVLWLLDPVRSTELHLYLDGQPTSVVQTPIGLGTYLQDHPDPMRAGSKQAAGLQELVADAVPIAVWAPLVERGEVVGVLGLGPRWTGEVYGEHDLQLIGILARQMTLAILNTRQLERLQAMSQLISQAEENERRKIARELHDTILQFLLVLTYGLDNLKERQAALTAEIERWQDRISAEAGQLRSLLSYLRAPELLVQQGLVSSLQSWLEQVRQETTMTVEADLAPEVDRLLSIEAKVAIYRVCREAVHNALKHSGGSRVGVRLWLDDNLVRFSVEDNGQGFDISEALKGGEKGYSSLQDSSIYVNNLGGRLSIEPRAESGTAVRGWITGL